MDKLTVHNTLMLCFHNFTVFEVATLVNTIAYFCLLMPV